MRNYLEFESEIKTLELQLEKLKDPFNNEGLAEVDTNKINQIQQIGCTQFAILFDDIQSELSVEDQKELLTFAKAQSHITNRLFENLSSSSLIFCPTVYCGQMADYDVRRNAYLNELGESLHEKIGLFWTGPEVVSKEIPVESIQELRKIIKQQLFQKIKMLFILVTNHLVTLVLLLAFGETLLKMVVFQK